MKIIDTKIEGVKILEPKVFGDSRGYFFESWNQNLAKELGLDFYPVQHNESKSTYGVVRGLHYQLKPYAQSKLVRVVTGKVLDVAVDLRKESPTFGHHVAVELSCDNKRQFLIPKGFAHGFAVLSETAVFTYLCDEFYNPSSERGIQFNDPQLNINWMIPLEKINLSDKDKNNLPFSKAEMNF